MTASAATFAARRAARAALSSSRLALVAPTSALRVPSSRLPAPAIPRLDPAPRRGVTTVAMSCGSGDYGRLGHGGAGTGAAGLGLSADRLREMTGLPPGVHVLDASAGGAHTAVVGTDGRAYTCGLNDHAQLGHSPSSPFVPILTPVDGLPDHDPIVSVSAGHHHTLCVTAGGELWAFGRNDAGQCGVGADAPRVISAPAWIAALSPDAPGNAGAGAIVSVAAGPRHSIAVTSEGAAYAWGAAEEGVLGHGDDAAARWRFWSRPSPEPVPRLVRTLADAGVSVREARVGMTHSACVDDVGRAWTWGQARFNQLGLGADPNVPANVAFLATPRRVPGVGRVTSLAAGGNFTVAVAAEGVVSWGANGNGELGSGARANGKSDRPWTAIQPPKDARVTSVAAGWRHAVCVAEDGRAFAWGWGGSAGQHGDDAYTTGGQLGVGDGQVDHWEPTAVVGLGGAARAVRASCGFNHTVVVVEMGEERRA